MPELPIRASMLDTCRFFSGGGMTLVIDAPASYEPERRYILDVVLTGWLGLDYELRLQDRTDVRLTVRTARIDNVKQQIRMHCFFERRAECGDKRMRQLSDEPHRIGDDDALMVTRLDTSCRGVECGEQLVRGTRAGSGQSVEER